MKIIAQIILILFTLNLTAQKVQIDTLKVKLSEKINLELDPSKNYFPIINSGNVKVDSLINFSIKNKLTRNESPSLDISSSLQKWAEYGLVYLDFKVTYNKNGILSLKIDGEGCGAYCTHWTDYLNYSTVTGKPLKLTEIVDIENIKLLPATSW